MWFHKTIVTVFGLGYAPKAPGTFGTLGAFLLLALLYFLDINIPLYLYLGLIIITAIIGIFSTDKVIPLWGSDPSKVVVDEFVGYLIAMILIPLSWTNLVLAFFIFRFFDILKPLGIRSLDTNIKGGLGVMLDDVLAGIYSLIVLHLINYAI